MTLFEEIRTFLTEDEWPFSQLEGKTVFRTAYHGKNGTFTCYAQAREEQFIFLFYAVCPINVPEDKRQVVAEFVTRANYGMYVGNFELDFTDGEVRYKTSLDVENAELPQPVIKNLVYAAVWTMDRYLPGLMKIIYGGAVPTAVLEEIEGE